MDQAAPDFVPGSGNVFDDVGFDNAAEMRLKAEVAMVIGDAIRAKGMTQKAAADQLGLAQPDVSNLLRGKLRGFSLDRLVSFLTRLNMNVELKISQPQARRPGRATVKTSKPRPRAAA
jgi:predicted XRE-type DNA-binding protein